MFLFFKIDVTGVKRKRRRRTRVGGRSITHPRDPHRLSIPGYVCKCSYPFVFPEGTRRHSKQWVYISCGTCVRNRINLSRSNYKEPYIRQARLYESRGLARSRTEGGRGRDREREREEQWNKRDGNRATCVCWKERRREEERR